MKINNTFKLIIAIGVSLGAGVIGSFFTAPAVQSSWYAELVKPALNPPSWVFGPVWTLLYLLIGISFFIVWNRNWQVRNNIFISAKKAWNPWSEKFWRGDWQKSNVISIFFVQLLLNAVWSPVFFGLQNIALAFFVILSLWVAILYTIINFYRISKLAAWLLVPYILWVSFAAYLNFAIWWLN